MRGTRTARVAIVATIAGMLLSLMPAASAATSRDRYAELQKRIAETRAKISAVRAKEKNVLSLLAASDKRRMALERSIAILGDQLRLTTQRLAALEIARDQAAVELEHKTNELMKAIADYDMFTGRLRDRAQNFYIAGPTAYSRVLLGAADFHSYVAGIQYAADILEVDMTAVHQMRDLKAKIEAERAEIDARRAALDAQTDQIAAEQARIAALRQQQNHAHDAVLAEIGYRKQLLAQVRSEKAAYLAALQSYLRESSSIAALLRNAQRGQQVIQGRGGYLKWPVSGVVTSEYGPRRHPIYGNDSFHTGIDIGAPSGTRIGAARAGEVLWVGYRGAYGLVVIMDHGNALATLYAHLTQAYVKPGDTVSTLGAVGAVGCTGWCTGPHLHFEVRVNGDPQNPRAWL